MAEFQKMETVKRLLEGTLYAYTFTGHPLTTLHTVCTDDPAMLMRGPSASLATTLSAFASKDIEAFLCGKDTV